MILAGISRVGKYCPQRGPSGVGLGGRSAVTKKSSGSLVLAMTENWVCSLEVPVLNCVYVGLLVQL